MAVAVHKGLLYLFRSYAFSRDLNIVSGIVGADRDWIGSTILVTDLVRRELVNPVYQDRLEPVDLPVTGRNHLSGLAVFRLR